MFRVDLNQNRLSRLTQKRFSELGMRERAHLQEWLANQPDALGEELLIIQKEFDGFNETRERLDLLALDKDGNLVVIENKRDDSGRDVTWQALKYAAYVSSLTKDQIVDIYQAYLDRYCGGGNATARICEFLDKEDWDEVALNNDSDQRLFFIAGNFRREVTATVMWLLSRGIKAKCFKVTPWTLDHELILDIKQIIPPPEAADFMISMAKKDGEEKAAKSVEQKRHKVRTAFWTEALAQLRNDNVTLYQNVAAGKEAGLSASAGVQSCRYAMIFTRETLGVELIIERSEAQENKRLFDLLHAEKDQIEAAFGQPLEWLRKDEIKRCQIVYSRPGNGYDSAHWEEMVQWLSVHIAKLEAALREPLARLNRQLRTQDAGGV